MEYHVIEGDARNMHDVDDRSVDLVVTSPPYNVGVTYDTHDDDLPEGKWVDLLSDVFEGVYAALRSGGRFAVNIAVGSGVPCHDKPAIVKDVAEDVGFDLRDKFVWEKGPSEASSAWGSWRSPSNPRQIFTHEEVLVFFKERPDRPDKNGETITKRDFMEYVKSVWHIPYTPADREVAEDHPAPFPIELPTRLVRLYSFPGDTVLDPFAGSGTTLAAALKENRDAVGYELSHEYASLARKRCEDVTAQTPIDDFF